MDQPFHYGHTESNSLCRATDFQLRNKNAIRDHLTTAATEQLIHSKWFYRVSIIVILCCIVFISTRSTISRQYRTLQQGYVTRCSRRDHIKGLYPSLLHWLPVECRIVFSILLLAFKCSEPRYLTITTYLNLLHHIVMIVIPLRSKVQHRFKNAPRSLKGTYGFQ